MVRASSFTRSSSLVVMVVMVVAVAALPFHVEAAPVPPATTLSALRRLLSSCTGGGAGGGSSLQMVKRDWLCVDDASTPVVYPPSTAMGGGYKSASSGLPSLTTASVKRSSLGRGDHPHPRRHDHPEYYGRTSLEDSSSVADSAMSWMDRHDDEMTTAATMMAKHNLEPLSDDDDLEEDHGDGDNHEGDDIHEDVDDSEQDSVTTSRRLAAYRDMREQRRPAAPGFTVRHYRNNFYYLLDQLDAKERAVRAMKLAPLLGAGPSRGDTGGDGGPSRVAGGSGSGDAGDIDDKQQLYRHESHRQDRRARVLEDIGWLADDESRLHYSRKSVTT